MADLPEIPMPQLLDPDRMLADDREDMSAEEHRSRAQALDEALRESCSYGTELWKHLTAVRGYLMDALPPDPRRPTAGERVLCASPTGPGDEPGWRSWVNTYAAVTSILAGPRGDSGFGLGEARQAEQLRRAVPLAPHSDDWQMTAPPGSPAGPEPDDSGESAPDPTPGPVPPGMPTPSRAAALPRPVRAAALGTLVLLALRGLLPRRPH